MQPVYDASHEVCSVHSLPKAARYRPSAGDCSAPPLTLVEALPARLVLTMNATPESAEEARGTREDGVDAATGGLPNRQRRSSVPSFLLLWTL